MIASFSGAHPYRPQCIVGFLLDEGHVLDRDEAVDQATAVTEAIDAGRCPRCANQLPDGRPVRPAGSRITTCRCVPICGRCGDQEALLIASPGILYLPDTWPLDDMNEIHEMLARHLRPAVLDLDSGIVLNENGVTEVQMRPHPGGWLEYGFDDGQDQAEATR
jgi:hypothetical protein